MGVETCILPTAVLSTHTMFPSPVCRDLTDQIIPITEHWKKENITFDAVYTGYLGSFEQISIVSRLFEEFKKSGCLVIADPVMADNGKLYPAFDESYARENTRLCSHADIILPNLTEAAFMTGLPYKTQYSRDYILELLHALGRLGAKYVLLTGVSFSPDRIGVMGLCVSTGETFEYFTRKIPRNYHGTGDIFSSTLTGALMRGLSLKQASRLSCDYTMMTIEQTVSDPSSREYGVSFEATLPGLTRMLAGYLPA